MFDDYLYINIVNTYTTGCSLPKFCAFHDFEVILYFLLLVLHNFLEPNINFSSETGSDVVTVLSVSFNR